MGGQELGRRHRLAVHLRRARAEAEDKGAVNFYRALLAALPKCRGVWMPCRVTGDDAWRLAAWGWTTGALVVVNFSDGEGWANVDVNELIGVGVGDLALTDMLTGEQYTRNRGELVAHGLVVGLRSFEAH